LTGRSTYAHAVARGSRAVEEILQTARRMAPPLDAIAGARP
jgi:hypothetical protein